MEAAGKETLLGGWSHRLFCYCRELGHALFFNLGHAKQIRAITVRQSESPSCFARSAKCLGKSVVGDFGKPLHANPLVFIQECHLQRACE